MRTKIRPFAALLFLLALVLIVMLARPIKAWAANRAKITDPHEGQVYIYDGFDWIWMTPLEGVPVNAITEHDFRWDGTSPEYIGDHYTAMRGVDVSEHQHEIDWKAVKESGIDFAFIRVARRGYSEGGLFEDEYYAENIRGASDAGLKVGVYFFSQAINVQEAVEEAEMTIRLLAPYQNRISLPVVYDWEKIYDDSSARTAGLDTQTLSDCAVAFCETVKSAGYTPGVYFNRHTGYYGFDLTRLEEYVLWFALPEAKFPSFYYATDIWQYSFTEQIPGINTPTDVNLYFQAKS
ncbi:MAG: glycoside hydrolase family 25 protein [Oscillospiraceae bacterium]|nr:glycoside hydrolase family 25 protein [Oscillospiraceae bacterium]